MPTKCPDRVDTSDDEVSLSGSLSHSRKQTSYLRMISEVILTAPNRSVTLHEIYTRFKTLFPEITHRKGWMNNIRHCLSYLECFIRVNQRIQCENEEDATASALWTIHPACLVEMQTGNYNRRTLRRLAQNASRDRQQQQDEPPEVVIPLPSPSPPPPRQQQQQQQQQQQRVVSYWSELTLTNSGFVPMHQNCWPRPGLPLELMEIQHESEKPTNQSEDEEEESDEECLQANNNQKNRSDWDIVVKLLDDYQGAQFNSAHGFFHPSPDGHPIVAPNEIMPRADELPSFHSLFARSDEQDPNGSRTFNVTVYPSEEPGITAQVIEGFSDQSGSSGEPFNREEIFISSSDDDDVTFFELQPAAPQQPVFYMDHMAAPSDDPIIVL